MSKIKLHKFIENDELDLSLQNLNEIPAKEISKFPKLKSVDLSCNMIENVTKDIGLLKNIIKLDLSKNKIQTLPDDFGQLVNLEYLDLRSNKLTDLPLSLVNLKKLKWLDLKGNPLNSTLSKAAGDCLDKSKCEKCAINVLELLKENADKKMKKIQKKKRRDEEILRQKELEEQKLREQKKIEKAELRAKRNLEIKEKKITQVQKTNFKEEIDNIDIHRGNVKNLFFDSLKSHIYHLFIFILFVACIFGVVMLLLVFCDESSYLVFNETQLCQRVNQNLPDFIVVFRDFIRNYAVEFSNYKSKIL